jgi:predicted nuclease of predicted toxin-antitoxin system
MNFVADASVTGSLVALLRQRGHSVTSIRDIRPDMPDEEVMHVAHAHDAILLTEDKDFGDLVVRQRLPNHGVVLFRLNRIERGNRAFLACIELERLGENMRGALTIIGSSQVRVRRIV